MRAYHGSDALNPLCIYYSAQQAHAAALRFAEIRWLYQWALDEHEPERELFLAISYAVYYRIFQQPMFQLAVQRNRLNLILLDEMKEEILQWIKPIATPTSSPQ